MTAYDLPFIPLSKLCDRHRAIRRAFFQDKILRTLRVGHIDISTGPARRLTLPGRFVYVRSMWTARFGSAILVVGNFDLGRGGPKGLL